MWERLEKLAERYAELTRLLSDPAVISNQERYRELSKEHSGISPVVRAYETYLKTKADAENLKGLALTSEDAYAEATDRFWDFDSALRCLVDD